MATRREQLAADAYERRRLVRALTGGVPLHLGAVLSGVALALVLAGVVMGKGLFASGAPTAWRACTADSAGISFAVARSAAVLPAGGRGAVVTDGTATWVVAGDQTGRAARYRLPADGDQLLARIGLPPPSQAVRVPGDWLALLPDGGTLGPATWVRAHWSASTLRPLAGTLCTELVNAADASAYVRLGTLPPDTAWTPPAAGEVSRIDSPVPTAPQAWLALLGEQDAG